MSRLPGQRSYGADAPAPYGRVSAILGAAVLLAGLAVLAGWLFDASVLLSPTPGTGTLKANAAAGLVLLGASIWFLQPGRGGRRRRRVATGAALLVVATGLLTLCEYAFGRDLGIDQLLFSDQAGSPLTSSPGRMAPNTAVSFLLAGLAITMLDLRTRRGFRPSQLLIGLGALISLTALLGHLYGVIGMYRVGSRTPMAAYTSAAFVLVFLGLALARPEAGLASALRAPGIAGIMARRLLVPAIALPLGLDLFVRAGRHAGLYDEGVAAALHATSLAILLLFLVALTTRFVARMDATREAAEEALRLHREHLEELVAERTAELEAANKELEAFSYSVSHDLRAPLRAVDGFAKILQDEHAARLDAEAQRYLGLVRGGAQQMGRLIDDLLALSRLGRQPLRKQRVQTAELVREVFDELRRDAAERRIDARIGDLPPCEADPVLLRQVFTNLLGNALKFTGRRETAVIEVGFERGDGETIYFVKDNGAGFDMAYSSKLFGLFQRLHRAREFEGTGVGLAIVKRIVTRHGGRVWAEGAVDQGATFHFTLGGDPDEH